MYIAASRISQSTLSRPEMTLVQRTPSPMIMSPASSPQPLVHSLPLRSSFRSAKITPTVLPIWKLLPLMIMRLSEGLIYAVIFPYINAMFTSFGVPEKSVGVWSATAESVLMVTEAFSAPLYAPLADRVGRRPVILVLIVIWGILAMGFGLVKTVWAAVLLRGGLGLLAGCGVLSRTMVGEMCDRSNRVQGFAVFSPALTVGVTIAPLIGGFLADPVPRILPASFTVFVHYPYLLPALVSGMSALAGAAIGFFLLPETSPPGQRGIENHETSEKVSSRGIGSLVGHNPFRKLLTLYGMNSGVQFCWEALYPLFAFTSKDLGGLGLSTRNIGLVLAFGALLSILMTVFIHPRLYAAVPDHLYLTLCLSAYPVAVLLFPVVWGVNYEASGLTMTTWAVLGAQTILRRVGDFATTVLDTTILDSIPSPEYLAMANSLTFSIAAAGRAIGPFIVSWFFSISTTFESFSFGRQLVWIMFFLICMPSIWLSYRMSGLDVDKEALAEEQYELISGSRASLDRQEVT